MSIAPTTWVKAEKQRKRKDRKPASPAVCLACLRTWTDSHQRSRRSAPAITTFIATFVVICVSGTFTLKKQTKRRGARNRSARNAYRPTRPVARLQGFAEQNTSLGGRSRFCFNYIFNKIFSERNKTWWETKKIWGGIAPRGYGPACSMPTLVLRFTSRTFANCFFHTVASIGGKVPRISFSRWNKLETEKKLSTNASERSEVVTSHALEERRHRALAMDVTSIISTRRSWPTWPAPWPWTGPSSSWPGGWWPLNRGSGWRPDAWATCTSGSRCDTNTSLNQNKPVNDAGSKLVDVVCKTNFDFDGKEFSLNMLTVFKTRAFRQWDRHSFLNYRYSTHPNTALKRTIAYHCSQYNKSFIVLSVYRLWRNVFWHTEWTPGEKHLNSLNEH